MRRKGRDLEKFVSKLERLLSGSDIEIKSPDYILDIHTKRRREVDVSLRAKVGSTEVLIILECRDRSKRQDVTWIEQIASKRDSIQAARAVAVSATGFSTEAIDKARMLDIDLRSIDNLTLADIYKWCGASVIIVNKRCYDLVHLVLYPEEGKPSLQLPEKVNIYAPLFFNPQIEGELSINDIWQRVTNQNPHLYEELEAGAEPQLVNIVVELSDTNYIRSQDELIWVEKLLFSVRLWIELSRLPPSKIIQYSSPEGKAITQSIVFEVDVNGNKLELSAHHDIEAGTTHVGAELNPPQKDN